MLDRDTGADALSAGLAELAAATARLLTTAGELTDDDVRAPSRLPGWTRAHVLTHVARNADGLVRLVSWARDGQERAMYDGGSQGRAAAIEEGARRRTEALVEDVASSALRLAAALSDLPAAARARKLRLLSGTAFLGVELPLLRIREVEIHHVDLDFGYAPAHWSSQFAGRTLDQVAAHFRSHPDMPVATLRAVDFGRTWRTGDSGATVTGREHALAAWLVGRSDGHDLSWDGDGPLSAAPPWT